MEDKGIGMLMGVVGVFLIFGTVMDSHQKKVEHAKWALMTHQYASTTWTVTRPPEIIHSDIEREHQPYGVTCVIVEIADQNGKAKILGVGENHPLFSSFRDLKTGKFVSFREALSNGYAKYNCNRVADDGAGLVPQVQ